MIPLTLDDIVKNLTIHHTWQSVFDLYGISISSDISSTGCDTYSVVQRNKFIKTINEQQYSNVLYRLMDIRRSIITYMDTADIDIRYSNDSLNQFYAIIEELGCEGPKSK